jgi:Ca2+-binding RTX toxin-like protein
MLRVKSLAVAGLVTAVVAGSIAITLTQAGASAHPGIASVWVDQTLGFWAGTGTVNTVVATPLAGGGFTFTDSSGTIELKDDVGSGCQQTTSHTVTCSAAVTRINASLEDGNDKFNNKTDLPAQADGQDGDDLLVGGSGPDDLYGGPGSDLIYGGYGDDHLDGGVGVDTVYGQAGNDELQDNDNQDALWGSSGNDEFWGGRTIHGDDDNDLIHPALTSEIWGGTEYDTVDFADWNEPVHVSLDGNWNDGNAAVDPTSVCSGGCIPGPMNVHTDVEKVVGTRYADLIIGNNSANAIDAGAGNDRIDGRGGDDYLDAEAGSGQIVRGGAGNDTCVGYGITVREACEH